MTYMLICVYSTLEQYRLAVVVLHKLFHLPRQILYLLHSDGMNAHSFRESDEVGISHARVRVAVFVE